MKNPGFILKVNEPTKFSFSLKSVKYEQEFKELFDVNEEKTYSLEPPSLCICIYELETSNNFTIILDDENYAPASWGFTSK